MGSADIDEIQITFIFELGLGGGVLLHPLIKRGIDTTPTYKGSMHKIAWSCK